MNLCPTAADRHIFAAGTQGLRGRSIVLSLQTTESRSFHSQWANGPPDAVRGVVNLLLLGGVLQPTLDIFKRVEDGQPEWVEAIAGLEEAMARMARLNSNSPGDYFIYSVSGQTVVVESAGDDTPIRTQWMRWHDRALA